MYTVKVVSVGLCYAKQLVEKQAAQEYYLDRVKLFNSSKGKDFLRWHCGGKATFLEISLEEKGNVLEKWTLYEEDPDLLSYKAAVVTKENDIWRVYAYCEVRDAIKEAFERGGKIHFLSTDNVSMDTFKKLLGDVA